MADASLEPSDPTHPIPWTNDATMAMRQVDSATFEAVTHAHYLVVVRGPDVGAFYEIGSHPTSLGRGREANVVLPDKRVSSRHCELWLEGLNLFVRDLGSTNGTWIDGNRIASPTLLPLGGYMDLGGLSLRHERRTRAELTRELAARHDLSAASKYVRALLPDPLATGPIEIEWIFQPSADLGGDAFHYEWLDPEHLSLCLIDVCGHGAAAALHSVAALNALRNGTLSSDPRDPGATLAALARAFPMERHGGMFFTAFLATYVAPTRELRFASAGHPPALLSTVGSDRFLPLGGPGLPVGSFVDARYANGAVSVPEGSRLYLASDGTFEFPLADGTEGTQEVLERAIREASGPAVGESRRILGLLRERSRTGGFDDDFSLLVARFR